MINYTKKDEDFHGIFKLVSGEEVLAKAVITEDNGDCLVFLQDPVCIHAITKEISDQKVMRGMGFTKWMPMSDEEFFIVRDRDIITMGTMSKPIILMYEAFILGDDPTKTHRRKSELNDNKGYLGKIEDARLKFEKLFRGWS
tara:strand:+ start:67 stop:492 length:426 start_codon:yes stop_codon:yes gene_type:complete